MYTQENLKILDAAINGHDRDTVMNLIGLRNLFAAQIVDPTKVKTIAQKEAESSEIESEAKAILRVNMLLEMAGQLISMARTEIDDEGLSCIQGLEDAESTLSEFVSEFKADLKRMGYKQKGERSYYGG